MEPALKNFLCGALLVCVSLLTTSASAKEKATKLTFDFNGQTRILFAFVPNREGPLPVVVLLHGSGRDGQIMIEMWKDLAAREGIILAAPNSFNSAEWNTTLDPPEFLHAVVAQVQATHAIDESRIYLFGHSGGAVYGLLLAIIDSEYFAATAVHAGKLLPQFYDAFPYAKQRMPIAICVGDQDAGFPVTQVLETKRVMESNGFHVNVSVIPNHDHNYYGIANEINSKAWNFLKNAKLKPPAAESQE